MKTRLMMMLLGLKFNYQNLKWLSEYVESKSKIIIWIRWTDQISNYCNDVEVDIFWTVGPAIFQLLNYFESSN